MWLTLVKEKGSVVYNRLEQQQEPSSTLFNKTSSSPTETSLQPMIETPGPIQDNYHKPSFPCDPYLISLLSTNPFGGSFLKHLLSVNGNSHPLILSSSWTDSNQVPLRK